MIKLVAVAVAATMMAGAAQAESWRIIDGSVRSGVAIDADRITEVATGRQFWALTVYKRGSQGNVVYSLSRWIAHCGREEMTMTFSADYADDGQALATGSMNNTGPAVPGTRGALMFETVCSGHWFDTASGITQQQTIEAVQDGLDH